MGIMMLDDLVTRSKERTREMWWRRVAGILGLCLVCVLVWSYPGLVYNLVWWAVVLVLVATGLGFLFGGKSREEEWGSKSYSSDEESDGEYEKCAMPPRMRSVAWQGGQG